LATLVGAETIKYWENRTATEKTQFHKLPVHPSPTWARPYFLVFLGTSPSGNEILRKIFNLLLRSYNTASDMSSLHWLYNFTRHCAYSADVISLSFILFDNAGHATSAGDKATVLFLEYAATATCEFYEQEGRIGSTRTAPCSFVVFSTFKTLIFLNFIH
jgi:hypothetical protein